MVSYSDAWVFTSILLNHSSRSVSLQQIVGTGDVINHAILTVDEINSGINLLLSAELIELKDKDVLLTKKGSQYLTKTFEQVGLFRKIEIVLPKLKTKTEGLEIQNFNIFSNDDVSQAYNNYRGLIYKSRH